MRIGMAQINVSMGAISANCARMGRFLKESADKGVDLTVFPELALVGYPPQDLLKQEGFVERSVARLEELARDHRGSTFITGFVDRAPAPGKGLFNAAALISKGKIQFIQRKMLLPTYDVFDEARYFDASEEVRTCKIQNRTVALTICEDIWAQQPIEGAKRYQRDPANDLRKAGSDLFINISASPFHEGKAELRHDIVKDLATRYSVPVIYVNLVGGNDELLFDGASFAMDGAGKVLARAEAFREDLTIVDLATGEGDFRKWPESPEDWVGQALEMGIRDYVHKTGFQDVIIGLSGGIDSSLMALLAVEALGPKHVIGVSMPSRFTSSASRDDAEEMARKLGIQFYTIPIDPVVGSFEASLADAFAGRDRDVTEENLQARVRGTLLMGLSNKFGALVLSTGNKSELAVGYCTQYGDMAGGLAAISDLPKERVYRVARLLNERHGAVPNRVFERPPTAELRPNQKDEDSLPPYSILDPILRLYVEELRSADSIVAAGFERETVERVIQLVDRNEFKRRQAAPGLRLSVKAFGRGRQMPIARGEA